VKRYIANAESGGSSYDDTSAEIQLPTIQLPRFYGDIGEWVYYHDKFTALITLNTSLTGFVYLKASLMDDAESLQSSHDTFTSLWNALKEQFKVKRVKADEQILKLFNLKPMPRDSATELRHMIDVVIIKSQRVLETIDLKLDSLSEMFVLNLLCSRLHEETRKAFQLQLKPTVYPKWSKMLTFLKTRCHSLENYEQI
jgi:hypothetical protein